MNHALQILGDVEQYHQILGATKALSKADNKQAKELITYSLLPGLVAGVIGALVWKNHRVLGFIGEPRVNVLALNMALDAASTPK